MLRVEVGHLTGVAGEWPAQRRGGAVGGVEDEQLVHVARPAQPPGQLRRYKLDPANESTLGAASELPGRTAHRAWRAF